MERPDIQVVIKHYPDDIPAQRVHPAADLFPMMTDAEFVGLTEDIAEHGLATPIQITEAGELLDGRHRLTACYTAQVDPVFERTRTPDPWGTVVSHNLRRRDLTTGQRAFIGVAIEQHYADQAPNGGRPANGTEKHGADLRHVSEPQLPNNPMATDGKVVSDQTDQPATAASRPVNGSVKPRNPKSSDKAGADVKVSGRAIEQAKRVAKVHDLAEQVKAGTLALDAADKQAKQRLANAPTGDPAPKKTLSTIIPLYLHDGTTIDVNKPAAKSTFNPTNDHISWAAWSWNPVTGCLHGCTYCYAREIASPASAAFPAGFAPALRPERLDAPANTTFPRDHADPRTRRVFVGSMADLFGEWVPIEWINAVFDSANKTPEWDYLFLTKFPQRYKRLTFPPGAWAGTSVDTQQRVRTAEKGMSVLRDDPAIAVRWLSIEPLLEPLIFSDLSWCDLMVIGAQTATRQPDGYSPEFAPPFEWVADLVAQARAAGVPVYLKPNLVGKLRPDAPGMTLPQELPNGIKSVSS